MLAVSDPSTVQRAPIPDAIASSGVIAIARGVDAAKVSAIGLALLRGGVSAFELTLNEPEEGALRRWFRAEKVGLTELRPLRLYKRADRYNARAFLRSLAALGRQAGFRGLLVAVDNLDALMERDPETGRLRYTRGVRDEAYEAIRELVDDVDEAHGVLWLFAGRRAVLEDERAGISSYEALRLRLLPEVRSSRFNPYDDVVDLDQARALGYLNAGDLRALRERAEELAPAVRQALAESPPPAPPAPSSPGGVRQIVLAGIHHGE